MQEILLDIHALDLDVCRSETSFSQSTGIDSRARPALAFAITTIW
ncbi:MAG TPA: hypothetical protein VG649_05785 [Candidatus Angelobacter sp.]|nr:hypothetical protein [Candidatus Angelobacter sp.]